MNTVYIVVERHVEGTAHFLARPGFHTKWLIGPDEATARFANKADAETARNAAAAANPEKHSGRDTYHVEEMHSISPANA